MARQNHGHYQDLKCFYSILNSPSCTPYSGDKMVVSYQRNSPSLLRDQFRRVFFQSKLDVGPNMGHQYNLQRTKASLSMLPKRQYGVS